MTASRFIQDLLAPTCALALLAVWGAPALPAADLGIRKDREAVQLTIRGEDGREYTLEALQDLLEKGQVWQPIATVAPVGGPVSLGDPTCTVRPRNFFRLREMTGPLPAEVPNFRLTDLTGHSHDLFHQSDANAVALVFAGDDLDSLAPHAAALNQLAGDPAFPNLRLWVIAIGSPADRAARQARAVALGLNVPVLEDEGGVVTDQIALGMAPEAVLLRPIVWSVAYRGRIQDLPVSPDGGAPHRLLADAVQRQFANQPLAIRRTSVELGRPIPSPRATPASYTEDVAPILRQHCVKCHSPGNIAPWAMTNHAVVRDHALLIKDEILTRRMPPWHADRQPQNYSNDEMLSPADLATLVDWLDQGAPLGSGIDPLPASVPPPPGDWPLGTPDAVAKVRLQSIPATGTIEYRYEVLPNPFGRDVWLRAALLKPGNRQVVHHALVFTASSFADILQVQAGLGGYFAAYVPGMEQVTFPENTGKLLKRNAFLVFQLHYTATGKPETDLTELGFYLAPETPRVELRTAAAYNTAFRIPPNSTAYSAQAEFIMPRDGIVYEMSPHMHYRGSWFRFDAIYPDNRRETLLNVPFYRFDWQTLYRLASPKRLPAGTRVVTVGGWDNSSRNAFNPDPSIPVEFGEQSWQEMLIGYFNWADAL